MQDQTPSLISILMNGESGQSSIESEPPKAAVNRTSYNHRDIEANKLVAYCDHCKEWWNFLRNMNPTPDEEACPNCGGKPSQIPQYQITTQRSFNPLTKKLTKAQMKKMGIGA